MPKDPTAFLLPQKEFSWQAIPFFGVFATHYLNDLRQIGVAILCSLTAHIYTMWLTVRPKSERECEYSRRCKCKLKKAVPGT